MRHFAQTVSIMGRVLSTDSANYGFQVQARSGDIFPAFINVETWFHPLQNLDELNQDRFTPGDSPDPASRIRKYLAPGCLIVIEGIYQEDGPVRRIDVRTVR